MTKVKGILLLIWKTVPENSSSSLVSDKHMELQALTESQGRLCVMPKNPGSWKCLEEEQFMKGRKKS